MQTSIFRLVPILCLALACGGGDDVDPVDHDHDLDAGPSARPPSLAVTVTPLTVAAGQSVTLTVEVENFEIVNPMTTPGVLPGKGHFHHQLDTADAYTASWTPSVTVPIAGATPPGAHTLDVWLVNGAHVDIDPPTHSPVTITVE